MRGSLSVAPDSRPNRRAWRAVHCVNIDRDCPETKGRPRPRNKSGTRIANTILLCGIRSPSGLADMLEIQIRTTEVFHLKRAVTRLLAKIAHLKNAAQSDKVRILFFELRASALEIEITQIGIAVHGGLARELGLDID